MPCLTLHRLEIEMKFLKHELLNKDIDLKPPMEISELTEFERENMVRFPADYRAFLLEIGNGILMGDGPCKEGILRLGHTPIDYPLDYPQILENLNKQFPFEFDNGGCHKDIGGYITLGTAIGSYRHFWILICDGICRGEVWIVTYDGEFFPCTPRMTFKDWLKDWAENEGSNIEQSLQQTKHYPLSPLPSRRLDRLPFSFADLFVNFRDYQTQSP